MTELSRWDSMSPTTVLYQYLAFVPGSGKSWSAEDNDRSDGGKTLGRVRHEYIKAHTATSKFSRTQCHSMDCLPVMLLVM